MATSLIRQFSPLTLLIISINGMIGSAWLFAPFYAAKIAGSAAIIAWVIGGAATATIALTFAELSVLIPLAGGTAHIPKLSHGMFTSFILSWIAWLSSLTMAPIEVQAVLQYSSIYFPHLVMAGSTTLSVVGLFWAAILMLLLCIINVSTYKGLIRFNFLLFTFKIAIIFITICTLLHINFHRENFAILPTTFTSFSGWHTILSAVATGGIAFAFTGFKHGVELAGESQRPAFSIPLAIVGSVVCCSLIYIGLQCSFIAAVNPSNLIHGWSKLNYHGDIGPFAGLAAALGLGWLIIILYMDAIVSPLGAALVYVTSTARILYAMSHIGYVPSFIGKLNQKNFPVRAIAINFCLGMFLFLPLPGWQAMVSFLVSAMVISYAMGPIALLCLRIELPQQARHFRLPCSKLICLMAFYFCNLLCYWTGWDTMFKLAIAILIGVAIFIFSALHKPNLKSRLGIKSLGWIVPYLLGLILISYLGSFGGKNLIPFGWDFLIIGLFSLFVLILAVITRSSISPTEFEMFMQEHTL